MLTTILSGLFQAQVPGTEAINLPLSFTDSSVAVQPYLTTYVIVAQTNPAQTPTQIAMPNITQISHIAIVSDVDVYIQINNTSAPLLNVRQLEWANVNITALYIVNPYTDKVANVQVVICGS